MVEGWWNGYSRNRPTNNIFREIHRITAEKQFSVHTRYVPSAQNPADDPSRGIYGPRHLLLPHIPIPDHLQQLLVDFDADLTPAERQRNATQVLSYAPKRTSHHAHDYDHCARQQALESEAYELDKLHKSW